MAIFALRGGCRFDEKGSLIKNDYATIELNEGNDFEIDLTDDSVILPGLVDFHAHFDVTGSGIGISEKSLIESGVMVVGDPGTYGWKNWTPIESSQGMIRKSWISLIADGLSQHPFIPNFEPSENLIDPLRELFNKHRTALVGLKIRLGQHSIEEDRALLYKGMDLSRELQVPIMIHPTKAYLPIEEVLEQLKRGDVLTHVYHGYNGGILKDGKVVSELFDAIDRGVILDIGHGGNHFAWNVYIEALKYGIKPDMISTDLTKKTLGNSPVYNLPYVMSKLLISGLTWTEIFNGVYKNPLDFLKASMPENSIVVLEPVHQSEKFYDAMGNYIAGNYVYKTKIVVSAGKLMSRKDSFKKVP